jgi:NHL repeat-containing protein
MSSSFVISDSNNHVLRTIDSSGIINTLAITSTDPNWIFNGGWGNPWGMAVDPSGNLYVADNGVNLVYKVDPSGNLVTAAGSGGSSHLTPAPDSLATDHPISPFYLATDAAGNFYVSDSNNCYAVNVQATTQTLLGVSIPAGWMALVAGNGHAGYSGDGGPALSAALSNPYGVAVDSAGNLYICCEGSFGGSPAGAAIRKVDAVTGVINTVAGNGTDVYNGDGGLATSAGLGTMLGVTLDAAGNIYISGTGESSWSNVRAVNTQATPQTLLNVLIAPGFIETVAGGAGQGYSGDGGPAISAEFNVPWKSVVDSNGDLYITDTHNNRIRKVDHATGIVTTVAGNGTAGYTGDGGPATSAEISHEIFDVTLWSLTSPTTGSIIVRKATSPSGSPQSFTFTPSWGAPFSLTDGQSNNSGPLAPGTYSVVETPVTGWATTTSSDPLNIVVTAGVTTTVTFTNSSGNIVIQKATVPTGSGQVFTFTPSYNGGTPFTLTDGTSNNSGPLVAGTYSVTETPVAGWTTATSSDPTAIVVTAGATTTVTFTNTAPGTITVRKATVPTGSSQSFSFTSSYGSPFHLLDGQSNNSGPLVAGTYSVAETPVAGWTTITSQDPTAIVVTPGSATTITFTNTATPGRIITTKVMIPPSTQQFTFSPSWGPQFTLTNGQSNDSGSLAAGTYNISETPVDGWTTMATPNPANLAVADGQTTTVTFTNTSSITGPPPTCDTPISTLAENVLNRLEEKFDVS